MSHDADLITCRQLVELVTDYVEGTLPDAARARIDAHLGLCDGCGAYVAQMRMTLEVVGHLTLEDLDPAVERALLDAFRDWKAGGP
jgi:anti-sigma factor RsiW